MAPVKSKVRVKMSKMVPPAAAQGPAQGLTPVEVINEEEDQDILEEVAIIGGAGRRDIAARDGDGQTAHVDMGIPEDGRSIILSWTSSILVLGVRPLSPLHKLGIISILYHSLIL